MDACRIQFSAIFLLLAGCAMTFGCSERAVEQAGATTRPATRLTDAQADALFAELEARPFALTPELFLQAAARRGMEIPPSPADWELLLRAGSRAGYKSRSQLVMAANRWGERFVASAWAAYGNRSDVVTASA